MGRTNQQIIQGYIRNGILHPHQFSNLRVGKPGKPRKGSWKHALDIVINAYALSPEHRGYKVYPPAVMEQQVEDAISSALDPQTTGTTECLLDSYERTYAELEACILHLDGHHTLEPQLVTDPECENLQDSPYDGFIGEYQMINPTNSTKTLY